MSELSESELSDRFCDLVEAELPLPGKGETLRRWQWLTTVATEDLALAKLVESHFDALAVLAELGAADLVGAGQRWAVWAAEPPNARLSLDAAGRVSGTKAWCSGADLVGHALVTAWTTDGQPQLVAVDLDQPGIEPDSSAWAAVGMGRALTPDLHFDAVPVTAVGRSGRYTERPGFWHGGAGVAACWYGGTLPIAEAVRRARPGPHRDAHLGAIDVALRSLAALLRETAAEIDRQPDRNRMTEALRVRAAADETARLVLDHAGRAVGAGPLCRDRAVARHFADLPVFIRQTHAEQDLAELAARLDADGWSL